MDVHPHKDVFLQKNILPSGYDIHSLPWKDPHAIKNGKHSGKPSNSIDFD